MTHNKDAVAIAFFDLISRVPLLGAEVSGNAVWRWLLAALAASVLYVAFRILLAQLVKRAGRLSERTQTVVDDLLVGVLRATSRPFVAILALLAVSPLLELDGTLSLIGRWMVVISLTLQVGLWSQRAIILWLEVQQQRLQESDPGTVTTLQGLSYVIRAVVWGAVVVLMLDNLGYNVSALLAGLGIGGVAVALALQNVLGDLFASLSIALDKPFVNGDFIVVGEHMGTVARIGLKTTRVTSLSGEQLVFANSDLLQSRIKNFKRMQERRVVFGVGVLYQTSTELLAEIPELVRSIIERTEHTRFDRAHFKGFGDSAYLFEFVYYVLDPDYAVYMNCQQHINLELCREFEARGIDFAYPTRTLHVARGSGPLSVSVDGAS